MHINDLDLYILQGPDMFRGPAGPYCPYLAGLCLAPLNRAVTAIRSRIQGGARVVIRFDNGYGAVISEHPRLQDIFEIVPLRFFGPGPDDYEFHFRSQVPDLSWCSNPDEIAGVCRRIARLRPSVRV
jgi:hypothetical protein